MVPEIEHKTNQSDTWNKINKFRSNKSTESGIIPLLKFSINNSILLASVLHWLESGTPNNALLYCFF